MTDSRPDPDALLDELKREELDAQRGRLKIFFGACAGVGKTYAMLAAARAKRQDGAAVLVGVVETHGRKETQEQLADLEVLPPRQIAYKGHELAEFDLDTALERRPQLILMDEFAHSNAPGSRHPKRWQDVEELLAAGIDVYTTLNVQHLESLNDVVGQITGIVVRETLPDHVFDRADEVALVDLPPDELLGRLAAGKVYLPQQAERAVKNFFRKGNLLALRELALRRTADRVDAQMRAYRADQAINPVWHARERLLVCVGSSAGIDKLIRSAKRLAASLDADWIAVYVETPQQRKLSEDQRARVLKGLKLAQELGAETTVLGGSELAPTLLAYARSRNVSKLVLGKSARGGWSRLWRRPLADELSRRSSDVDLFVVAHEQEDASANAAAKTGGSLLFEDQDSPRSRFGYLAAFVACLLTTALAGLLIPHVALANDIMIYLLVVVLVSVRYGRGPGMLASLLSVASFDFFFVPPHMSFAVSDTQYLMTFVVMLLVASIISQLTARLRFEANISTYRERRTRALYDLGRELAGALTAAQIVDTAVSRLEPLFAAKVSLFLPNSGDELRSAGEGRGDADIGVAQWVYDHQQPAGLGTNTLPANAALYVPLRAPMRNRGVIALLPDITDQVFLPEQQRLLETCAAQIALALERVHYVEVAQDAIVAMESERLRNSVLSVVSHDLRTPLTTMAGLSERLCSSNMDDSQRAEIAAAIQDEALRMNKLVTNLLDMARLQSGVKLNKEWQMLDEVVGSALRAAERGLRGRKLTLELAPDLPVLEYDAVLLERVLVNLLENAGKYTPPGSHITLAARREGAEVVVSVSDDGPGLPPNMEERAFDKFSRGAAESSTPGVGLGLAICRSIVEIHGGRISARNRSPHGAEFRFSLPAGQAPALPEERPEPRA
ncbi:sensor histidine kinase [Chromobacterium haemolyticum]|uniref:histidine kinase n=1 Tax=Chromobacterium haemolyticum TaxID=394935 RepID=A0A1W0CLP9_9NEIS|nr:sensor histidine kinase KdpD [Chromobacterium haemolyticum]OQS35646.1 two-component system sensor histidine kinase KdbD [Chromobacterium haemolyticum]